MTTSSRGSRCVAQLTASLESRGFDIVVPFSVRWYNDVVSEDLHLPTRDHAYPLGILVGNSLKFWPKFIESLHTRKGNGGLKYMSESPVNDYVMETVSQCCEEFENQDLKPLLYWSHEVSKGRLVAIQRLAATTGEFYHDKTSHLCLHPRFGPWIAFRAVVLLDVEGDPLIPAGDQTISSSTPSSSYASPIPTSTASSPAPTESQDRYEFYSLPPPLLPCPLSADILAVVKSSMDLALNKKAPPPDCSSLPSWRRWLAVREALSPNHPLKYSTDQLEYHYTQDKQILVRAMQKYGEDQDKKKKGVET